MKGHPDIIGVRVGDDSRDLASHEETTIEWHVVSTSGGDYLTACGMDGNDPAVGQHGPVSPVSGAKVTCASCYSIWQGFRALTLRDANFAAEAKKS